MSHQFQHMCSISGWTPTSSLHEVIACNPDQLHKASFVLVAPLIMLMVLCAGCEHLPAAGGNNARRAAQRAAAASAPGLRGI